MKNVFDKLSPTLQLILAQCSTFGLDLAALLSGGAESVSQRFSQIGAEFKAAGLDLKAILNGDFASLKKAGDIAGAIEQATKVLQEQLTAESAKLTAALGLIAAHSAALTKFGAVVKPANAEAGVTEADITAALDARASIKAADQLAKHGLPAALPLAPAADASAPAAKPAAAGLSRTEAAYRAKYPHLT